MMVLTFNDGFEQVVVPRLDEIEDKVDKHDRKFEEIIGLLESVHRKMDSVLANQMDQGHQVKDQGKRLDKVERIVKAN